MNAGHYTNCQRILHSINAQALLPEIDAAIAEQESIKREFRERAAAQQSAAAQVFQELLRRYRYKPEQLPSLPDALLLRFATDLAARVRERTGLEYEPEGLAETLRGGS